jgi:hypothetical protein
MASPLARNLRAGRERRRLIRTRLLLSKAASAVHRYIFVALPDELMPITKSSTFSPRCTPSLK